MHWNPYQIRSNEVGQVCKVHAMQSTLEYMDRRFTTSVLTFLLNPWNEIKVKCGQSSCSLNMGRKLMP